MVLQCQTQPQFERRKDEPGSCPAAAPSQSRHVHATLTATVTTLQRYSGLCISLTYLKEYLQSVPSFCFYLVLSFPRTVSCLGFHLQLPTQPPNDYFCWEVTNSRTQAPLPAGCICRFMRKKSFISAVLSTIRGICLSQRSQYVQETVTWIWTEEFQKYK